MLRKFVCALLVISVSAALCGCEFFTADTADLLSPPALTGDMLPIAEAIDESVPGEYSFEYPSRGDYRSAVIQHDIDKDGALEAFAFYSTEESQGTTLHINAIRNQNGEWSSVSTQKIIAGGVDRVAFCDLDRDGSDEILVGWEIYGASELQLAVYTLGENSLTQRMLEQYTHFTTCDLDYDGLNEIFIIRSSPAESSNTALLFSLTPVGVSQIATCELDSAAKTFYSPVAGTLSTGQPAVYIDAVKGVGAVTAVLYMEKNSLVNPLLDPGTRENTKTIRSATLEISDINNDGILEIPIQSEVPAVTKYGGGEKQYLTNWCSFNGTALTNQLTTVINSSDRYYISIPQKWQGKIAVLKDSEECLLEIYRYDQQKNISSELLLRILVVEKSDWDSGNYKDQELSEIVNDGVNTYLCYIADGAYDDGITLEKIKSEFKLY